MYPHGILRTGGEAPAKGKRFTKAEWSWIFYDWANSVYATNIMAAIFPIWYAMNATDLGNKMLGIGVSIASLVCAVLAPTLGAVADFKGYKKKLRAERLECRGGTQYVKRQIRLL